jgi:hypothetical protein
MREEPKIELNRNDEIINFICACGRIKFIIEHKNNSYILTNLKCRIIIKIDVNHKPSTIAELIKHSEVTFFSMYGIKFGKKDKDEKYNFDEFTEEIIKERKYSKKKIQHIKVCKRKVNHIDKLKIKLINKYQIYFMAAEKMEIAYSCINL